MQHPAGVAVACSWPWDRWIGWICWICPVCWVCLRGGWVGNPPFQIIERTKVKVLMWKNYHHKQWVKYFSFRLGKGCRSGILKGIDGYWYLQEWRIIPEHFKVWKANHPWRENDLKKLKFDAILNDFLVSQTLTYQSMKKAGVVPGKTDAHSSEMSEFPFTKSLVGWRSSTQLPVSTVVWDKKTKRPHLQHPQLKTLAFMSLT